MRREATALARAVRSGETTAAAAVEESLARIAEVMAGELHAFLSVREDAAREEATEVDRRVAAEPAAALPLAGVPVAVKDNIAVAGDRLDPPHGAATTCGSKLLEPYVSPFDATAIRRLRRAGAIVVAKTNLDEFAMGSSTENSAFGPTLNPHDRGRVAGGSSGGSAAAVATGCVPIALGSETGGSVRQPAAFCGVVGVKPTYGRVSRFGLVAFGSSFDQIGTLARTVEDAAQLLAVIAGVDSHDETSVPDPVEDWVAGLDAWDPRGLRIGWPVEYFGEGLDPRIRSACETARDRLTAAGADVVEVSLPHASYGIAVYYVVAIAEASSNLARYDGVRYGFRAPAPTHATLQDLYFRTRAAFGAEVKRRIMLGTYVLSAGYYEAFYGKGTAVRARIRADFDAAWERVDALLSPTTPTPAFRIGEKVEDPLEMYLNDVYTVSANLAGIPAISIPYGRVPARVGGGADRPALPIGIQIMGPALAEKRLFRIARFLEREGGKGGAADGSER
ncbi:MAG TPA: Asp-tRNA(Asn)/Glu-tRNA(Gln) amidotransferase subunit GatA [Gemmatimonadota bacterium]|nr:Asp-tRNA(Asn)/Glu-tRNA(Gln) amidotransferase subunit GatA [Gemmatimonadota bacterium]